MGLGLGWDGMGPDLCGMGWDGMRPSWDGMEWDGTFMGWDGTGIPACPGQHVTKERYQCCKLDE